MKTDVFLHFRDGLKLEGSLSRPFLYEEGEIEIDCTADGKRFAFLLEELCVILFLSDQSVLSLSPREEILEDVSLINGEVYRVYTTSKTEKANGFFARVADTTAPWGYAFFPATGIRLRSQLRQIGSILAGAGVISETVIAETLKKQEELRNRRVGEIIAETNNIRQETIDKTISDTLATGSIPANARVGDILVAAGLVTREQVEQALATQDQGKKKKVGELLIEAGLITEEQLLQALATKFCLRMVDLEQVTPTPEALALLSKGMVNRLQVFPLEATLKNIIIATSSPTDPAIGDSLRFITNRHIELVVAPSARITAAIDRYYNNKDTQVEALLDEMGEKIVALAEDDHLEDTVVVEPDSKVISLINNILIDAYQKGVSDIHFEPGGGKEPLIIRYRIDGECYIAHRVAGTYKAAIVSRLKIIANLDIAERRRPQSGKILLRFEGKKIEYRLEVTPTIGAQEDAVLRILAASKPLPLDAMGFSTENLDKMRLILAKPYGLILCVGPTGSGKTTSLHSALGHINNPSRKIWTVEDPVEITQKGLRQVQVNAKIGFNFAEALRSFLRADPDVIMIGEMRDAETAKIAIESSLTGHLVLSTLHTNSAPETAVRLIDMGMDPFNFADALLGILAQRLARKLCEQCRKPYHPGREEYDSLVRAYGMEDFAAHSMPPYLPELRLMRSEGCEKCGGSGYKGRIALHELLIGTPEIKDAVKKSVGVDKLRDLAIREGMRTLKMDGIRKMFLGITDFEQVNKVCL